MYVGLNFSLQMEPHQEITFLNLNVNSAKLFLIPFSLLIEFFNNYLLTLACERYLEVIILDIFNKQSSNGSFNKFILMQRYLLFPRDF